MLHRIFNFGALVIASFGIAVPAIAQSPFELISADVGFGDFVNAGVPCWFDYDNDEDLDILISSRFGNSVSLYSNQNGQFVPVPSAGLPTNSDIFNAQPLDFDRDGDMDIFLAGYGTDFSLIVNEFGTYVDETEAFGIEQNHGLQIFTWIDIDQDRYVDLLFQDVDSWRAYKNVNGSHFEDFQLNEIDPDSALWDSTEHDTLIPGLPDRRHYIDMTLADYDLDGDFDMFMTQLLNDDGFYENYGPEGFVNASDAVGLGGTACNCGSAFVDFNNDGYPDLLTPGSNYHSIWLNQNGTHFEEITVHGTDTDFSETDLPRCTRYAVADYDMDGDFDFVSVRPGGAGRFRAPNQLFRCDSIVGNDAWFTDMAPEWDMDDLADGTARFADYDRDGDLDLMMILHGSQPKLYRNTTNQTNRLEIQLVGFNGEQAGWHRRIEVYSNSSGNLAASGSLTISAVSSSGWNSYFVLDEFDSYSIFIYLEDGRVFTPLTNPELANIVPSEIDHMLLFEVDVASEAETPPQTTVTNFRLHPAYPNPFNPNTSITFDLAQAANVRFRIFNVIGEEVALINLGQKQAGTHEFEWNASALSSGIYFGKIEAGAYTATQKLVLMK